MLIFVVCLKIWYHIGILMRQCHHLSLIHIYHLRPIIRGKETKSVEFGAKVNNIQIDEMCIRDRL